MTDVDGKVGAVAHPPVSKEASRCATVEVHKVDGLMMNFDLQPI